MNPTPTAPQNEPDGPDALRWCGWCYLMVPTTEWLLDPVHDLLIHMGVARWCRDEPPGRCLWRERIPQKV